MMADESAVQTSTVSLLNEDAMTTLLRTGVPRNAERSRSRVNTNNYKNSY